MEIRDGLAASLLADFEMSIGQVPRLLEGLDDPTSNNLLADIDATETLALSLLVFGSTAEAKHYLQKPLTRLSGKTPLHCIKTGANTRDEVIADLIRLIEGYVF
ncbi:MAG: hypothetical protein CVV07_10090 [Gammaproteobacteria bacterium HGW-Gammaproteobacteria-11]|jgi:hypothetical protein|nr:MAG: hypothetical protein CVV07_10090 [Gammaproteobacteria bacterium HGW-Gammaproteobacteria-11]